MVTIRISKRQRNRINAIKRMIEESTGNRVTYKFVIDVLLELLDVNSLSNVVSDSNLRNLLRGTDISINKIFSRLKWYRDELRRVIPKDKLEEWYLCICNQDENTYKTFTSSVNFVPNCFDYSDIEMLLNLCRAWVEVNDIPRYLYKKIEKRAIKYYMYLGLLETALKNRFVLDSGNVNISDLGDE